MDQCVCVNQQYLEERSSQVKRMAKLYTYALRVIVWLGLDSDNSALVVEYCREICFHMSVNWQRQTDYVSSLSRDTLGRQEPRASLYPGAVE